MNAPVRSPSPSDIIQRRFRPNLLAWYDQHARDLPWRKDRDPYRVWVSEIMLQQTRVAAVMAHYHEFLHRFPTVEKLAAARESSVLAAWSGLGYYRRARMLREAAKVIVHEHNGKFPQTVEELRALPGIGRYTAAAIASIAFGKAVALVDGNVERVLQRFSGTRLTGQQLWEVANELLDTARPADFNQAMMELGATVCTPRAPGCLVCPVREFCATRGELEPATKASAQRKREIHYALIRRDREGSNGKVLLVQRPGNASLMANMWELPEIEHPGKHMKPLFTVRHSITTTDYTVRVCKGLMPTRVRGKWFSMERLAELALTGLARKILRKAEILSGPTAVISARYRRSAPFELSESSKINAVRVAARAPAAKVV